MEHNMLMTTLAPIHYSNTILDQSTFSDLEMEFYGIDEQEFSCSFGSPENSIGISSNSLNVSPMFFDEIFDVENLDDLIRASSDMNDNIYEMINENNSSSQTTMETDQSSPCFSLDSSKNSIEFPLQDRSQLLFPGEDMEMDKQLILTHLSRAYAEAQENKEKCLTEILMKSVNEKTDPMGNTLERVAYHLFNKYRDDQDEYLKQELSKNFLQALKVLYLTLVDSRFAHFTANSVILESPPHDAMTVHIVDFDMGQGVQWPPLIEAFSCKKTSIKITSIVTQEVESSYPRCTFEETKKQLLSQARQFGVKLQIEAKSLEDLADELTRTKKRGQQRREYLVFNCMVGLPHMGYRRSRSQVMEFLRVAKESLTSFPGIVTLGEGETWDSYNDCHYASRFDHLVRHYQALFESLERNFPAYLVEARTTIESLFLEPLMCLDGWYRDWVDTQTSRGLEAESLFKGRRLSPENTAEAKLMISGRDQLYEVRVDRHRDHEMVLRWRGVPLVKVSSWMEDE